MPAAHDLNGKVSALLFDFGGTLAFLDFEMLAGELSRPERRLDAIRLEQAEYEGRAALDRRFLADPKSDVNQAYDGFMRAWMGAVGISEDELPEIRQRLREMHEKETLWRVVRPGTFEALERMKSAGLKLGIVSNADGRVEADARRFGLAQYFDVIIDSDVVGVSKPDPRIFHIAMERLRVAPGETLYTGDIYSIDMIGARAAGITGKLIDCLDRYNWVEHQRIRHIGELHRTGQD